MYGKETLSLLVNKNGAVAVVEVKKNNFTIKAKQQLQSYMHVYGIDVGIAVAQNLTCCLPEGIKFVPISKAAIFSIADKG